MVEEEDSQQIKGLRDGVTGLHLAMLAGLKVESSLLGGLDLFKVPTSIL